MTTSLWAVEAKITPNDEMVELFHSWDTSKQKSKLKSFNRTKEWISRLMKRPLPTMPESHKMRQIDIDKALICFIDATHDPAFTIEAYVRSLLKDPKGVVADRPGIISPVQEASCDNASKDDEEVFTDAKSSTDDQTVSNDPNVTLMPSVVEDQNVFTNLTSTPSVEGHQSAAEAENNKVSKKAPVCRYTWLGQECQIVDCQRSHPNLCKDPKCLDLDQDLPRWKAIGCVNWHGRSKKDKQKQKRESEKKQVASKQSQQQKSHTNKHLSHGSHLKTKRQAPLQWLRNKRSDCQQFQQSVWDCPPSGNGQATWSPQTRGGNTQWGMGRTPYNVVTRSPSPKTRAGIIQNEIQKLIPHLVNQILSHTERI